MTQEIFNIADSVPCAPVFVGGLMKSGTSLLRKLISQSPSIFGGLETHWFNPDFRNDASLEKLAIFFQLEASQVHDMSRASASSEDFLSLLMAFCARRDGKDRWVEKTPGNILHAPRIWAHWPHATLIRVKRDPRDVFASWKNNKGTLVNDFIPAALEERSAAEAASSSARYIEVTYEALVSNPQAVINVVFGRINEADIPDVASYVGDATDANLIEIATGKTSATAESLKQPVFSSSVGAWRHSLTPHEIDLIAQNLG